MSEFPQLNLEQVKGPKAVMRTNMGEMTIQLFPDEAPKTVENFIGLAKKGYYDGVIFHRVISNFMIQGGDPTGSGMGGDSLFGGSFEDEFSPNLYNLNGALSMANAGPNTNTSQFFIVTMSDIPQQMVSQLEDAGFPEEVIEAYKTNGGTPWLDQKHTVFGHLIDGQDVSKAIENVEKNAMDKPNKDIIIETITIID
ncbi:MAG: peptidylprolyl isomerase [Alkalibacterium sp.]|nr:peptidylprolyl isomerase [Alkalibacterium sp.]